MESTERRSHWQRVYGERPDDAVSWHQDTPGSSLTLIEHTEVEPEGAIIDIGGGASRLVDHLVERGYRDLTVLDVSAKALALARGRLGVRARDVAWMEADVLHARFSQHYDVWHDRAVFHFLTDAEDRRLYREQLQGAVPAGGHVIIATFAPDGPTRCSGLPVVRYSPESLQAELAPGCSLVETWHEDHHTPADAVQKFVFCRFRRE